MDFERPHGEILLASELAERAATYANRTVRVVGCIAEFDPATDQLTLSHGEGKVSISTRLLAPVACRKGDVWHFIGEVEEEPTFHVLARVGGSMAGLDLRLFIEALKVRRQCLADLDETMDAMAAAAAMSQFD